MGSPAPRDFKGQETWQDPVIEAMGVPHPKWEVFTGENPWENPLEKSHG